MAVMTRFTDQELYHMHFKERILLSGLAEDQIDIFGEWAFGDDFKNIRSIQVPERWNKLHKDKLELSIYGDIRRDINNMVKLFQETRS